MKILDFFPENHNKIVIYILELVKHGHKIKFKT